jgi:uncharacterized protein YutE (UPF0331/DUF86 family)
MTPPPLDLDIVTIRLRMLRDTLDQLRSARDVVGSELQADPMKRAAIERLEQVIVDLAVDINSHIAATELGRAPSSGRESFELAAATGAIEASLADMLAPSAGLRNILVHRYTQIDIDKVAGAVASLLDGFDAYVRQVAAFVSARQP